MITDFFRGFTATHKTVLIVAALITPGALYGAVSYQAVSIVDPNTGANSLVDAGRRLYVYDPIAGYANNPSNFVKISGSATGDGSYHSIYTVPAGKAFVVKSANMSHFSGIPGNDNYLYIYESNGISLNFVIGYDDTNAAGSHYATLGTGFYLHSGETLQYISNSGGSGTPLATVFSIEGFLVPATAIAAAASLESAQQAIRVGGAPIK